LQNQILIWTVGSGDGTLVKQEENYRSGASWPTADRGDSVYIVAKITERERERERERLSFRVEETLILFGMILLLYIRLLV
jgi:hypothetical protein